MYRIISSPGGEPVDRLASPNVDLTNPSLVGVAPAKMWMDISDVKIFHGRLHIGQRTLPVSTGATMLSCVPSTQHGSTAAVVFCQEAQTGTQLLIIGSCSAFA